MYILELVVKEVEGTWCHNILVSKNKDSLLAKIPEEKQKYLAKEDSLDNGALLFLIGDLENFIFDKLTESRKDYEQTNVYTINNQVFHNYNDLRTYLILIATPVAEKLGVNPKMCETILKNSFYASLNFKISEIEEI